MNKAANNANIVGSMVRKMRCNNELTQDMLAARCGVIGWNLSRGTLAKIEAGVRCVADAELWVLARALRCPIEKLYPDKQAEILRVVTRNE
jgi:DNA-binding XRE family transcriptional regulator